MTLSRRSPNSQRVRGMTLPSLRASRREGVAQRLDGGRHVEEFGDVFFVEIDGHWHIPFSELYHDTCTASPLPLPPRSGGEG